MALGFGNNDEKKISSDDGASPDVERQDENYGPRRMSRIDRPITGSISGLAGGRKSSIDETGAGVSIGQQMEAEAGNAIQYRTCSWQKVYSAAFLQH